MGVLRLLAIPIRRFLHDEGFAGAIITAEANVSGYFGSFTSHATAGLIWTIFAIIGSLLALLSFLVGLTYVIIPMGKGVKNWQRAKIGGGVVEQERHFQTAWLTLLGLILLITADAVWSNVTAFGLYQVGDQTLTAIKIFDVQRTRMNMATASAERFFTGLSSAMEIPGNNDLQLALEVIGEFKSEIISFSTFLRNNSLALQGKLQSSSSTITDPIVKSLIENAEHSMMDEKMISELDSFLKLLSSLQGPTSSNEGGVGFGEVGAFLPSLDLLRARAMQMSDLLKREELSRFIMVFIILLLLTGITAAGLQFYRMQKFRIVFICLLVLCVELFLLYLGHAYHLATGGILGAFCDAAYGTGGQVPFSLSAEPSSKISIDSAQLYQFSTYCAAGDDLAGAMLKTFAPTGRMTNFGSQTTIDPEAGEVIVKTSLGKVVLSVNNGRADLKRATENSVLATLDAAGPELITHAITLAESINLAAKEMTNYNFSGAKETFRQFSTIINTLDYVDDAPADIIRILQIIKIETLVRMEKLGRLLDKLETFSTLFSSNLEAWNLKLNEASRDPSAFLGHVRRLAQANIAQFVADTLQPAMECQEAGMALSQLYDVVCGAGGALQSLFLALGLLINLALGVAVILFVCRKFSNEQQGPDE